MENINPNVKTIEGVENVKEYYYSINALLEPNEEVLVFGARSGNPNFQDAIDFFVNYVHDRSSKSIKTKILYNVDVQTLGKTYESIPLVQVRYMPMGLITKVGVNIYRDTIDMLDWSDPVNPKVIVIEDKHIADSYREYFNMLWSATVAISDLEKKGNFWLPEILFEDFVNHTDEKEKVEQAIIDILSNQNPRNLLNIGSGFDTLSSSKGFPDSIENITIVEKNTSYVQSYTQTRTEVVHADFEFWETDQKYDAILASHVLYYFNDKKAAIAKILSRLNSDGIAIFVSHEPSKDYKKLKDFVFGIHGKKYTYTYDKLSAILKELDCDVQEIKVDCTVQAKSPDELYKVLRLWLEMDLKTYYENEKDIKAMLTDKAEYVNSIFVIRNK
ncbi:MAG: methyltransferase domain-containing protein [Candidatus Pacearchaeota archaeon]